jgi:GT2 family glycosyltransferase
LLSTDIKVVLFRAKIKMLPHRVSVLQETKPRVAIVVLNYNGKPYVKRCLDSLFNNTYPNFEVIFVDNDSPDKSADLAQSLFGSEPRFTMIRNSENLGFSIGNNVGFERANAKYVVSLNNDTEVQKNFIETLVGIAESDDSIGSVGCKIVQLDGRVLYGPRFMNYGFIVRASDTRTYNRFSVNLANCGCATLFRKSILDEVSGFDPVFWTDWEDHDLGYRINIAGFKCVYSPSTTVLHLGGGNYLGLSDERETRIIRNKLFTFVKNYQTKTLFPRFPLLLAMMFLGKTKHGKTTQFLEGLARFFKMSGIIRCQRKQIQKARVVSDEQLFSLCRIPERQSIWKSLKLS